MFGKILIANRGEIACRVARTARRLGIATVAVYSDVDAGAMHASMCDEAIRIGPAPARESYLRADRILEAARRSGAEAIHPGYGFLSENETFAQTVADAGLVFVGPPPGAIRAMGSKSESKRLMERAGVPLVPGYHGEDQDDRLLAAEADRIGYPVLIKASLGGGGKGMRVVGSAAQFAAALASARREAAAAFGDERVLVERYLTSPRHIEIQVFADTHGHCVHLFERDCSVQRRHQKVLEEAPAPGMTPARRAQMGETAVRAARAVGYAGAGTVEFIADAEGGFFFMEMNTRLQVEHPVTEMITGLDLVEWQLRVAAGERLPLAQDELAIDGHAIEARIYAEDPERGFLPSVGRLVHLRAPETSAALRIDSGVRAGDAISQFYDPMIAKLIVHGRDRAEALSGLAAALVDFEVAGVATNVGFLRRTALHPEFAAGRFDTGFIARHHDALIPPRAAVPREVLAIAALAEVRGIEMALERARAASSDRHSPWARFESFWPNTSDHGVNLEFVAGESTHTAWVRRSNGVTLVGIDGAPPERADVVAVAGRLQVTLGDARHAVSVVSDGEDRTVFRSGMAWQLRLVDRLLHAGDEDAAGGHLLAPMSGTVVAVHAKAGDRVEKGQPLLVLEAMKMEHTICAPADGVVEAIHFAERDVVAEGAELATVAAGA